MADPTSYKSNYFVVSEDFWRFRFSAGYGFNSDRMDGFFGGVEFKAHDWVTLLGEYDTHDTNVGIRLLTPEIWITPIRLTATFKSSLSHDPGHIDIAAGLTFPLDFQKRSNRAAEPATPIKPVVKPEVREGVADPIESAVSPVSQKTADSTQTPMSPAPPAKAVQAAPVGGATTNTVTSANLENLSALKKRIEAAGLIEVRAGQRSSSELVVEYENTIFNHNELDALGIVAGTISEVTANSYEIVHIVIKRKGLRVAVVSMPRSALRAFMKQAGNPVALKSAMMFSYDAGMTDDTYYPPQQSGFSLPNTSLIVAPGLTTFVGTEVGVFDYLLSIKPEILSTLWKGG